MLMKKGIPLASFWLRNSLFAMISRPRHHSCSHMKSRCYTKNDYQNRLNHGEKSLHDENCHGRNDGASDVYPSSSNRLPSYSRMS